MKLGIIGLPNVGKAPCLMLLLARGQKRQTTPSVEPNVGVVAVPNKAGQAG